MLGSGSLANLARLRSESRRDRRIRVGIALGGIFAFTFLLPPRPRSKEELARIAAEAGIPI